MKISATAAPGAQIRGEATTSSVRLGAHRNGPMVDFLVWALLAQRVEVHFIASDEYVSLKPQPDGYFAGTTEWDPGNSRYFYRLNGSVERPDPASRWQPEGVHRSSAIFPSDFEWADSGWDGIELADYITYELHVGTYTPQGTFAGLIDRLAELHDLGVTAVELMPVAEFAGPRNWGYDGVYSFAAHHAYGGPLGLKQLVNACHSEGLAVVLDVVYNHLGPEGSYLSGFGPYFTDRYNTPWGSAINFDGPYSDHVVRYFVENALQWLDEFHIDALRLDAIHGIIDRNAQPFLTCLSKAVEDLARARHRKIHLIAESDLNDSRVIQSRDLGGYGMDAQWSDDFHHALHALQTGERDGYYEDYGRVSDLAKAFRSGFVYEGQYSPHRKQRHGNSAAGLKASQIVVCSQNHDQVGNRALGDRSSALLSFEGLKLSAAVVLLSPFLPLLFMGEEFAETHPFLYFTSHGDPDLARAVREGRRKEFSAFLRNAEPPDPQSEASFQTSKVHALVELSGQQLALRDLYRELIRLRRSVPALRYLDKDNLEARFSEQPKFLVITRGSGDNEVLTMFNFEDEPVFISEPVVQGRWKCLLDSTDKRWLGPGNSSLQIAQVREHKTISLAPRSAYVLGRDNL